MKKHKIKGVDINVCCAEQKIAYNYLFTLFGKEMSWSLDYAKQDLERRKDTDMKKFDTDLIFKIIRKNFQSYSKNYFIAGSYEIIGKNIIIP